jgi:hypothetical protein
MPDEKILEKLGKIKAHMESAQEIGSEAEAQAFATMLQNMLLRHKLEMTDIQYSSHLKDEPVEESTVGDSEYFYKGRQRFYTKYPDVEVTSRRSEWAENLMRVICDAHSCSFMVYKASSQLCIVGRKSDAAIVEYLFIMMHRVAEKMCHQEYMKFRRQCRKQGGDDKYLVADLLSQTHGFKSSWLSGFTTRLAQRFEEEKKKMEQSNSGTALARINREALAVREYLKNRGGKSAKILGGRGDFNTLGYQAGKSAADRMNLKANAFEGQGGERKELE